MQKYSGLVDLKGFITPLKEEMQNYKNLSEVIKKHFAEKDAIRKDLDTNAKAFMKSAVQLISSQHKQMLSDVSKGVSLDKRIVKLISAFKIQIEGTKLSFQMQSRL